MLTIKLEGVEELRKTLAGFSDRRFQSAIAEALNNTAKEIRNEWGGQFVTKLDRPTSTTRNATMVRTADVGRLTAIVAVKDRLGDASSLPPSEYLSPQEFGGERTIKKFERALQSRGAMPTGHKAVPGKYAQIDGFGNVRRQQIVQVLAQLGTNLSPGYRQVISADLAKRRARAGKTGRTYVAFPQPRGELEAGIYEAKGRTLLPIFFFVSSARYGRRLSLLDHAQVVASKQLPRQMDMAIQKRIKSLAARGGR